MKTIFVDFDGTICPNKGVEGTPPPSLECLAVLHALKNAGHEIIIYSVRSNEKETSKPGGHNEMLEYLEKYRIPFDGVDMGKTHFTMVIDDKGCGIPLDNNKNVDWDKVGHILEERNYIGE